MLLRAALALDGQQEVTSSSLGHTNQAGNLNADLVNKEMPELVESEGSLCTEKSFSHEQWKRRRGAEHTGITITF